MNMHKESCHPRVFSQRAIRFGLTRPAVVLAAFFWMCPVGQTSAEVLTSLASYEPQEADLTGHTDHLRHLIP